MKRFFLLLLVFIFCLGTKLMPIKAEEKTLKPITNLLLIGVDSREGELSRSDTIMLLNIHEDKINVISVPRDTMVTIPGKGRCKINAAYTYGGIDLCKKTIENLFHTTIDDYIIVNFQAVEDVIDAMGGVNINIPSNIAISNPEFKRYVYLKQGFHQLNGYQAIEYLRYRSDPRADIGRIERQQKFLKDLQKDFIKFENIAQVPKLFDVVKENIKTDIDPFTAATYFEKVCEVGNNIEFFTLQGNSAYIDKVSYYISDSSSLQHVISILGSKQ